jgi:hypothetical protein
VRIGGTLGSRLSGVDHSSIAFFPIIICPYAIFKIHQVDGSTCQHPIVGEVMQKIEANQKHTA